MKCQEITKEQVMPLLLQACPSFFKKLKEHQEYCGEVESLYSELGELADHLIDLYNQNQTQEFPVVFKKVEELHIKGDHYVREATIIGLLEGIQNLAGNQGLDPEVFLQFLEPETAKWWRTLNRFWNGEIGALNDTE